MTNQKLTFDTLDSFFLNTDNFTLNVGELREKLIQHFDVEQRNTKGSSGKSVLRENLENSRRSVKSLVWGAFIEMTNSFIEWDTGERKYTCTSQQLKKYLAQYGYTLENALQPVVDEITRWRNEVKAGKEV